MHHPPRRPVIAAAGHNGRVIEELIARMAALLEPLADAGDQRQCQVLLKLAATGFGVRLPAGA